MPIIVYNSFMGNGKEIFDACLKLKTKEFILVTIENIDWDNEMTPYFNPPIFKNDQSYQGLGNEHLKLIEDKIIPEVRKRLLIKPKEYILAGYSLAGLFSIFAIINTNYFTKFVSGSGSLWYPNFIEYFKNNLSKYPKKVYLSLGNTEKNGRDMSKCVQDKTEELLYYLKNKGIDVIFELNEGGHFKNVYLRIAKGIKWIL